MTIALIVISIAALFGARIFLDSEIEASLLNVASIQAAAVTAEGGGTMRFHEWDLTPQEAAQVRELNRYAQVWSASGESLLRTQYITHNLPLDTAALHEAAAGRLVTRNQQFDGLPIRSLYYPLERMGPEHARHVLQVAAPLTARDQLLNSLAWLLLGITALVGATSFAGGWWLGGRMVRPVDAIIDQAESMSAGTLGNRITAHADIREYQRLVDVLNLMLARLEGAFEAQRRFTADASHELRSPLTALKGEIELALRRQRAAGEYRSVLASNLQEVDRLTQIAEDLLTLARSDSGVLQPRFQVTDVGERVAHVAERLRVDAQAKQIALDVHTNESIEAIVDPALLDQMVWNLVGNAIKFTPAEGRVTVRVDSVDGAVRIEVRDTGHGIPAGDVERIFERFYRGDSARTHTAQAWGTGLGLSIVRAVVLAHGGTIRAFNSPQGGAVFQATLPLQPTPSQPGGRQNAATGTPGTGSRSRESRPE